MHALCVFLCVLKGWTVVQDSLKTKAQLIEELQALRRLAEEARKESDADYRAIFDAASDSIVVHDPKTGAILDANQSACALFGYSLQELLRLTVGDVSWRTPPYTQKEADEWIAKAAAEGSQIFEWKVRTKTQQPRWIEVNLTRAHIRGRDCLLAISRDITERKECTEELQRRLKYEGVLARASESLAKAADVQDAIQGALDCLVQLPDADHVHVHENYLDPKDGLCMRLFCEAVAEGIAPHMRRPELRTIPFARVAPELLPALTRGEALEHTISQLRDDVSPILREEGVRSLLVLPICAKGALWGLIGFDNCHKEKLWSEEDKVLLRTVASMIGARIERDRAYDALRESEEKYRTLFEDSLEPMSLTRRGKIVDANPAWLRLHGFDRKSDALGMNVIEIMHPDDRHILISRRAQSNGERERVFQVRDLRRDGVVLEVEVYSSAIHLDGELAILSTVHDITERKRLQRELLQSAKLAALGTMISGTAHELNNPLAAITGYAYLLADDGSLPDAIREDIRAIHSQAERCSRIVDNLLRFARRDPGEKEIVNINEVLAQSVDLCRCDLKVRGIALEEEYDPCLAAACANPWHLQQVFLNLIGNARDAIQDRKGTGTITLRTRQNGGQITIEVEDDGGGIAEPHRVFEPFYTTKGIGKGTGLGLSVAYGIIQDHGGMICAENSDKGARFTVRLPVAAGNRKATASRRCESAATSGKRTLMADDEETP